MSLLVANMASKAILLTNDVSEERPQRAFVCFMTSFYAFHSRCTNFSQHEVLDEVDCSCKCSDKVAGGRSSDQTLRNSTLFSNCSLSVFAAAQRSEQGNTLQKAALQMTSKGDLLRSKVCVVTGGGRGIGAAIAVRFAEEGACLILTARSEDQLEQVSFQFGHTSLWHAPERSHKSGASPVQTAKICRTRGATSCDTYRVDLAQRALVTKFATDVLSKFKRVDVLVNNAGTNLAGHFGLEGD